MSQDTRSLAGTEDKETFLVTLTQPRLYVQQVAFDKGKQIGSEAAACGSGDYIRTGSQNIGQDKRRKK